MFGILYLDCISEESPKFFRGDFSKTITCTFFAPTEPSFLGLGSWSPYFLFLLFLL